MRMLNYIIEFYNHKAYFVQKFLLVIKHAKRTSILGPVLHMAVEDKKVDFIKIILIFIIQYTFTYLLT